MSRIGPPDPWADFEEERTAQRATANGAAVATPPPTTSAPTPPPDDTPLCIGDELRAALVRGKEVLTLPAPVPLIEDVFDVGALSVTYGRSGSGKSFLAADYALCVASGTWWHGHEVKRGPVLYVAAEGQTGLGIRAGAWAALNRLPIPEEMTWLTRPANLLNTAAAAALAGIADELGAVLVVIDTLNRSMSGGDENNSKDMSTVIASCDLIRRITGAHVNLIHHSGKDQSAGARGHSSLNGAVDTELEVKNAGDGIITVTSSKQKEGPTGGQPRRFAMVPAAQSIAIGPYSSRIEEGGGLTPTGALCLEALDRIAGPEGIGVPAWRDAAVEAGASRTMFYEQRKRLVDIGLVEPLTSGARPVFALTELGHKHRGNS